MSKEPITQIKISNVDELSLEEADWELFDSLSDEEVLAGAMSDPDAQPTSSADLQTFQWVISVKELRTQLAMTQEQFAGTFNLSLATVRDWEQARTQPDQAARTLLRVIAYNPDLVREALLFNT